MSRVSPDTTNLWQCIGDALTLYVRAAPAHEIRRSFGAVLALSGEPVADLNYITIAASPDPTIRLREFVTISRARRLPVVAVVSAAVAAEVASMAEHLGLTHVGDMPLMTHDGQGVTAMGQAVTVAQVVSETDLRMANSIFARAFSVPDEAVQRALGPGVLTAPGLSIFLASRGGTPVSTVVTTRHGTTVGIWSMGTMPERQSQGTGYALLTHVMAHHRASDARLFYLGATEAGYPLYERVGFHTDETMAVWVA